MMIEESNGNGFSAGMSSGGNNPSIKSSQSIDDLSQSLSISEYTDADESMSAPTEFLAEFLSAVMLKDYRKALRYCKLILEFEPNNITAKEFYPLIMEKLNILSQKSSDDSDENYNNTSSSPEPAEIDNGTAGGGGSGDGGGGGDGIDTTDNSSNEGGESDFSNSSDLDELHDIVSQSNNSTNSTSENTTHSYPSSLLEEEDDLLPLPDNGVLHKLLFKSPSLSDLNNGNYKSNSCSDTESPTEPLTQQITNLLNRSSAVGHSSFNP